MNLFSYLEYTQLNRIFEAGMSGSRADKVKAQKYFPGSIMEHTGNNQWDEEQGLFHMNRIKSTVSSPSI